MKLKNISKDLTYAIIVGKKRISCPPGKTFIVRKDFGQGILNSNKDFMKIR